MKVTDNENSIVVKDTAGKMDYIRLISSRSDRYGNFLIEMMDTYSCSNLREITKEQAKEFYDRIVSC